MHASVYSKIDSSNSGFFNNNNSNNTDYDIIVEVRQIFQLEFSWQKRTLASFVYNLKSCLIIQ